MKRNLLILSLLSFSILGWASSKTYYSKATATVSPSGAGKVYVSNKSDSKGSSSQATNNSSSKDNSVSHTYCFTAETNSGYTFDGWYETATATTPKSSSTQYNESVTTNSTNSNSPKTINRYARWNANTYSIAFNGNGATSGSMSNLAMTYAKAENLTSNAYSRAYTVTYNANGGSCETSSATVTYVFDGWNTAADGSGISYTDGQSVENLTTTNGATINLYAQWTCANPSVTLPSAEKNGAVFDGWYSGDELIGEAGMVITPSSDMNLRANYVDKLDPEAHCDNPTLKVGDVQENALFFVHFVNPAVSIVNTNIDPINNGNDKVIEYDYANNTLTAHNAGTATIRFIQAETNSINAATVDVNITVVKHTNTITVNGSANYSTNVYYGAQQALTIVSENTNTTLTPIVVNQTSGSNHGMYQANSGSPYIEALPEAGTATWTVTQAEDYKYQSVSATISLTAKAMTEKTDCYVLRRDNEEELETKISSTGGVLGSVMTLSGPGAHLSFEAKKSSSIAISNYFIEWSADGNQWNDLAAPNIGTSYQTFSYDISNKDVKYLRFEAKVGATFSKYSKNVKVTRKTYINADNLTIERNGENYIYPNETGSAQLIIDWSCANGGDLRLKTSNDKFRLSQSTISNVDCNHGTTTITVYYDATSNGTDNATLLIYNGVYRKEVTLTGICRLHDQTITWTNGVEVMEMGAEVTDPASAITNITYTSLDESIVRVEGNKLIAVGLGTCQIVATAAASTYYYETKDTLEFEVSERKAQWIVWNQSLIGLRIGDANKVLNAYATSEEVCTTNELRPITYTSDNEAVVKVINGNELQVVGEGTTYVTAKQAGGMDGDGHNYVEATKQNKVIVAEPSADCVPTLSLPATEGQLFSMNTNKPQLQFDIELNPSTNGEPQSVTFDCKREKFASIFTSGNLILAQKINGEWQNVKNCGAPTVGSYDHHADVALDRSATAIRFYRPQGGEGYHDIANVVVKRAQYIETGVPEQIESTLGETYQLPVNVKYSGVSGMLTFNLSGDNPRYAIDKTVKETSCGDWGSVNVVVSYRSDNSIEDDKDTLTITDGIMTTKIPLVARTGTAARAIIWSLPDDTTVYTLSTVALNAECKTLTDITAGTVQFELLEESTTGTLTGNVIAFDKAGDVLVKATVAHDDNYEDVTPVTKTIHVAATPTNITVNPVANTLVYGRGVADVEFVGGEVRDVIENRVIEGTFSAVSGDVSSVGTRFITVRFIAQDPTMYANSNDLQMTVEVATNIFNVAGEWGENTNWSAGDTPRADEDVTIAANVTITGDVEVNSLTITEGNTVTLAVTGSLTINNSSMEQPAYGNMVVKEGGEIILNGGETKVNNFTIEASIGDNSHEAKSGEIVGIDHLAISGDAYFDLMLDQSGRCSTGWYHISVPFPVDVMTGIVARWDDTDMTGYEEGLRNERDYAIMDYHEEIRATGKYGWKKFRGIMMPGKGYSMTINNTAAYYRFKKASGYAVEQLAELQAQRSAGDAADCGWNALGNGMLNIANLTDNDITVQMHDHATKTYQTYLASEVSFAVGSSFFFQASSDAQAVAMELSAMHDYLRAPQARFATADERYTVSLTASGANRYDDRVFVSANEDALYSYQAGRDVAKMGDVTEATISQIWCEAYGQQLCRAELPLINDNATFPLGIFSPKAGEYILSAQNGPANGELWLTYEDVPVWNLSEGDYTLSLGRGTINGYALHLVIDRTQPATPTDAENITAEHDGVKKVLINNVLYIVRDGMIFDATGTKIELQ